MEEGLLPGLCHLVGTFVDMVLDYERDNESFSCLVVRTTIGLLCINHRREGMSE